MAIKTFKDLKVWKLSHRLSIDVAKLVKSFPKDEKYDLSDNMRRCARSIPSNISEGFGRYHFKDKLTFYERSFASLQELKNHFCETLDNEYINQSTFENYRKRTNEIGFLLVKLMKGIKKAYIKHQEKKK
jgi:four helix bundle protein